MMIFLLEGLHMVLVGFQSLVGGLIAILEGVRGFLTVFTDIGEFFIIPCVLLAVWLIVGFVTLPKKNETDSQSTDR